MTNQAPLLLYDFLAVRGGAERVLTAMQQHWGSDVCVGFSRTESFGADIPPEHLLDLHADHSWAPLKMARVLRAFQQEGERIARRYPVRVYAGSYSVLAHRTGHGGRALYYCHTPPRFLYDLRDYYAQTLPAWQRPMLAALRTWLQPRYEAAVKNMHIVLANSRNVQQRLKIHLGIDAQVVYPPVDIEKFQWVSDEGYFLSTSRLEPLKRVDVLVEAFKRLPQHKLIVASGGSQLESLKRLAANSPNIQFTGWLSESQLHRLMGSCRATLYVPQDEDFGMSPVESMAAGKPVIGVAEGGLLETVQDGETGLLAPLLNPQAVCEAVEALTAERTQKMLRACQHRATLFSLKKFLTTIDSIIK